MRIIKVDPEAPSISEVKVISEALKKGKVVVLPTETVYTLAVDATNKSAIEKVYQIKGRDFNKPLHVVVTSLKMAENYVEINKQARLLAKNFLPGPLTLVLLKRGGILPEILTSGISTLGIRIPKLELNLLISKEIGLPYTTTSANKSGGSNPYSVSLVMAQLAGKKNELDLIVDIGNLPNLLPSTLVDLTISPAKILREGPIKKEELEKFIDIV